MSAMFYFIASTIFKVVVFTHALLGMVDRCRGGSRMKENNKKVAKDRIKPAVDRAAGVMPEDDKKEDEQPPAAKKDDKARWIVRIVMVFIAIAAGLVIGGNGLDFIKSNIPGEQWTNATGVHINGIDGSPNVFIPFCESTTVGSAISFDIPSISCIVKHASKLPHSQSEGMAALKQMRANANNSVPALRIAYSSKGEVYYDTTLRGERQWVSRSSIIEGLTALERRSHVNGSNFCICPSHLSIGPLSWLYFTKNPAFLTNEPPPAQPLSEWRIYSLAQITEVTPRKRYDGSGKLEYSREVVGSELSEYDAFLSSGLDDIHSITHTDMASVILYDHLKLMPDPFDILNRGQLQQAIGESYTVSTAFVHPKERHSKYITNDYEHSCLWYCSNLDAAFVRNAKDSMNRRST